MHSVPLEPTAPSDPAGSTQYPAGYQPVPSNPPPAYEFTCQPPYSSPQQPGAPVFYPGGLQPATNRCPTTGFVYGSSPTGFNQQVGYIAPSSTCTPVVCGPAYKVEPSAVAAAAVVSQNYEQRDNYCGHIILAMIVFLCCCPVLGLVAFIASGAANGKALNDRAGARRLGRVSLALSISGIAIGVLVAIIVVSVVCSNYRVDGYCYMNREQDNDFFDCMHRRFFRHPYHKDGYCYWN